VTGDAPKVEQVALADIRTDGGTQARAKLDDATVEEYAALIGTGANVPPVVVFYDGETYWLADGFHRVAARAKAGRATVKAEVHQGTRRDAILYACGANAAHGLRRTPADKRRAVETLLRDVDWSRWCDREIARQCVVSPDTVGRYRAAMVAHLSDRTDGAPERTVVRNGKVYQQNTENIGKNRKPRVERDPEPVVDEPAVEATPEVFDAPAPDDVPAFVVDEPAVTEPEPPPAVVAAPPAPVRVAPVEPPVAPIDPPVAVVVPLVAVAPAPVVSVPTHDARGTEIPEVLRATYAAMTRRAERIARAAEALRAEFEELKNDLPAWRAETGRTAIATPGLPGLAHCMNQELPGLLYAARQFAPQYLCEDCSGRDPACKHCEGAGWEPEGRVRERLRQQKAVATARAKAGVR
jgi:uncharacterized ParB-like nuclease family protein